MFEFIHTSSAIVYSFGGEWPTGEKEKEKKKILRAGGSLETKGRELKSRSTLLGASDLR